jgi:energy-converting hydrogenase Eha subunit G
MTVVKKAVEDYEDRRDINLTYMLVGWLCWIFAFLVMFFNPSAMRLGRFTMVEISVLLAVVGLVLNIIGYVRLRRT